MKIKPHIEGREDDGYDNETIRYYESLDDKGYFYELYVLIDGNYSAIIITEGGVSVEFREGPKSGASIHTNIIPENLFPNSKSLEWDQLCKIIKILEVSDLEGRFFSKKHMDDLFEEWKSLNEDEQ